MTDQPNILYSFRRCPYAIRARFALIYAGIDFELREIKLSDKPAAFLEVSPKGTVPVLQLSDSRVIDESVDIVEYALSAHDPDSYALQTEQERKACQYWLLEWQPKWVHTIHRYKYHDRYPELNREDTWLQLKSLLQELDQSLQSNGGHTIRNTFSQVDILLLPLIRQFSIIDDTFFRAQNWHHMENWLDHWMQSDIYSKIMQKHPVWQP